MSLLAVMVVIIILLVMFFHLLQGFFSAMLSAICAIFAASLAFSYHEVIVEKLLGGKFANYAHASMLLLLFAIIYLGLRILLDKTIPGNVRVQSTLDKVGGAVCGLIAGMFVSGIFAVAAQELPFDVTPGWYARYPMAPHKGIATGMNGRQSQDVEATDVLLHSPFVADERTLMLIPTDQMLVDFVGHVSDGGSLAGSQPLAMVHPNFLDELLGQRLGQQLGDVRVLFNRTGHEAISVDGLYALPTLTLKDAESIAEFNLPNAKTGDLKASPSLMLVVVRVMFHSPAQGIDTFVRLSPGAVRLVTQQPGEGGVMKWTDLYPVGTLDNPLTDPNAQGEVPAPKTVTQPTGLPFAWSNRIDDYLFINLANADTAADFVFLVNPQGFVASTAGAQSATATIADNVFIEVKRMARVDLSGKQITLIPEGGDYPYSASVNVLRKTLVVHPPPPKAAPATPAPTPAPTTPTPAPANGGTPPPNANPIHSPALEPGHLPPPLE